MSESLTYAKARDFVGANLGTGVCPPDDAQIEVLMLNCLRRIHADVADDKFYEGEVELELVDGQCEYPLTLQTFTSVEDEDCNELEYCSNPPSRKDKKPLESDCECGCCYDEAQAPHSWTCYAGKLVVWPAPVVPQDCPVSIHMRGRRALDCTLYEIIDGVKHWKTIDLPEKYHTVYAKCLLAFSFGLLDDQPRANWWFEVAADELEAIKCQDDEPIYQPDGKGENVFCIGAKACDYAPLCKPDCKCGSNRLSWEFEDEDGRVEACC